MSPLVSVLIPCFNAERWLGATLASVRAQTHRPLEVVAVDDGSTDGTAALLESLAGPDLRVLRQANRGQGAALNAGLAAARGEYLQFLDADDLLDPRKIELQLARLAEPGDAVATCEWGRFRRDPREARFGPDACWRDQDARAWLAHNWAKGGGMMLPAMWLLPRAVAERAGPWNEALTVNIDMEYFVRALLAAGRARFAGGARCYYRSNVAGSVSARCDAAAWNSYFRSIELSQARLAQPLDEPLRRGLSLVWQRFAHAAFPYEPGLADEALRRARELHDVRLPVEGGWRFRAAARVLGWRLARRLQRLSGRT
jgi:glycosyltransferase involved in cell wall biosynthesis